MRTLLFSCLVGLMFVLPACSAHSGKGGKAGSCPCSMKCCENMEQCDCKDCAKGCEACGKKGGKSSCGAM